MAVPARRRPLQKSPFWIGDPRVNFDSLPMISPPEPRSTSENVPPAFAAFLSNQREPITRKWIEAVRREPALPAAKDLSDEELSDHLPKLFEDLAATLSGAPVTDEARRDAEAHGEHRWRQHYSLEEVLLELGIVSRHVLAHGLDAFADAHPGTPADQWRGARERILRFFEDAAAGSVRRYAQRNSQEVNLREERHRLAIEGAHQGTFTWELPSRRVHWNQRLKELFFLPPGTEMSFELAISRLHPDDREPTRRAVEAAIAGRTSYQVEYRSVNPADGQVRWLRATGRAFADPAGATATQVHGVVVDVTAEKLAQQQAAAVAQREHTILESVTDSFFAFDADWRFTYLNDAAKRGMAPHVEDPGSLLGRNFFEVFPYNRGTSIEHAGRKAMSEGTMADFEMLYEPWGRWYDGRCFPVEGGGLSVYFRETTRERQASAALRASEAKYRSLFDSVDSAFCVLEMIWDGEGKPVDYRFVEVNSNFERHNGLRAPVGKTARELVPNLEARWFEVFGRVSSTGEPIRFTEGSEAMGRWYDLYAFPVGTDRPRQVAVLFNDITERRKSENALRAAKAALHEVAEQRRLALDSAQMGWWHIDLATHQVHMDERFKKLFDVHEETDFYARVLTRVHPDYRAAVDAGVQAAIRLHDPVPYALEYPVVHGDGSVYWLAARGQASFEGEGEHRKAVAIFGTTTDITEAKTLRDTLQESAAQFRQLAEAMPQIVWAAGADCDINYYNERWYEYTGLSKDRFGQASWDGVIHPDDLARVVDLWVPSVAAGLPWEVEFRLRGAADEKYRWFLGRAVPIRDAAGKVVRWIGTDTDIHETRQLAERNADLLESERAARAEAERSGRMKDEFLATLSHELRTPLNAILGWTQVLRGDPANGEDVEAGLATIERNARAQNQIIDDLLDMSKIVSGKVRLDVQPLELDQVIKSAVETLRPAADAKSIRIQALIDPEARMISGDPNRLQQVFWNLLTNAIKFTPKGGRVQVVLERVNSHLEVSVIASGEGIARHAGRGWRRVDPAGPRASRRAGRQRPRRRVDRLRALGGSAQGHPGRLSDALGQARRSRRTAGPRRQSGGTRRAFAGRLTSSLYLSGISDVPLVPPVPPVPPDRWAGWDRGDRWDASKDPCRSGSAIHLRPAAHPSWETGVPWLLYSFGDGGGTSGRDDGGFVLGNFPQGVVAEVQMSLDQRGWGARDPIRQGKVLVFIGLEHFQIDQIGVTRVFHVVAKGARDEAHVPGVEVRRARLAAVEEHRHAAFALKVVLPFVRVLVPMQFPQAAGFDDDVRRRDGRCNRKVSGVDDPDLARPGLERRGHRVHREVEGDVGERFGGGDRLLVLLERARERDRKNIMAFRRHLVDAGQ